MGIPTPLLVISLISVVAAIIVARRRRQDITINVRVQAAAIYVSAAIWLGLWLQTGRQPENLPLLALPIFGLLPLLNVLLALFILESRIRHKQRCAWWVYLAVLVGFLPYISYALYKLFA